MANVSPTVQRVALQLLRYQGITQLTPQPAGSELESVRSGDLEEVAFAMTAAIQEIFKKMPSQSREFPMSAILHAPTAVTLTATTNSTAVAFISGWASWMIGCTIRIAGDDQDNEIVNATTLVKPFVGTTGTAQATVYGDAVALDNTVAKVIGPVEIPNQYPLCPATDRMDFIRWSAWPLVVDNSGQAVGMPFFNFIRKSIQRPRAWFVEGIYNVASTYTQRRIRFAPMPDVLYPMSFRVVMNPPRFSAADIQAVTQDGDPGTVIPLPDELVESGFLPVALHHYATKPGFKNQALLPSIEAAYKLAIALFEDSIGQVSLTEGNYVS